MGWMSVRRLGQIAEGAVLTETSSKEAIGHEYASEMCYPDGRRAATLADKVLDGPIRATQQFDPAIGSPYSGGRERSHALPR